MTKEEQQVRATLNDHIVIHKVTDYIFAMHKDGSAVYAVDVIKKPLVRCKDCKYASDNKVYGCMLNHFNDNDYDYHRMYADDFCSYGERREP